MVRMTFSLSVAFTDFVYRVVPTFVSSSTATVSATIVSLSADVMLAAELVLLRLFAIKKTMPPMKATMQAIRNQFVDLFLSFLSLWPLLLVWFAAPLPITVASLSLPPLCMICRNCCTLCGRLLFTGCMAVRMAAAKLRGTSLGMLDPPCCDSSTAFGGVVPVSIFSKVAPRA